MDSLPTPSEALVTHQTGRWSGHPIHRDLFCIKQDQNQKDILCIFPPEIRWTSGDRFSAVWTVALVDLPETYFEWTIAADPEPEPTQPTFGDEEDDEEKDSWAGFMAMLSPPEFGVACFDFSEGHASNRHGDWSVTKKISTATDLQETVLKPIYQQCKWEPGRFNFEPRAYKAGDTVGFGLNHSGQLFLTCNGEVYNQGLVPLSSPNLYPFICCYGKAFAEFNPNAKNPAPGGPFKSGPNEAKGKHNFEIYGNPLGVIDDSNLLYQNSPLLDLPQDILRHIRSYLDDPFILLSLCKEAHKTLSSIYGWIDCHKIREKLIGYYIDLSHKMPEGFFTGGWTMAYQIKLDGSIIGSKYEIKHSPFGDPPGAPKPTNPGTEITQISGFWYLSRRFIDRQRDYILVQFSANEFGPKTFLVDDILKHQLTEEDYLQLSTDTAELYPAENNPANVVDATQKLHRSDE